MLLNNNSLGDETLCHELSRSLPKENCDQLIHEKSNLLQTFEEVKEQHPQLEQRETQLHLLQPLMPQGLQQQQQLERMEERRRRRAEKKRMEEDEGKLNGGGFLRLHSISSSDIKIYASDEGRVQMTAAAFSKGG